MASLFNRIARFANSPQGRRAVEQAKRFANDPRRRQQAKEAVEKVRRQLGNRRRPQ
ncbi:hypothetical protein LWP59_07170 [Amycolatopsis acidiphila]|uniref:hypothetical protein n=1 Tax=Amycolatopsis acidiphila TaxID=715473 RepID=UPI001643BEC1|nr:hypothetical protein [Amycolatopsis acidiphila]UIJ61401.1 hypothetical protein LWP59_07170 [Amycolatopsis acidiphila]GHG77861.1 hypothetical protein GCM10017788_44330 [Amycolatopsis acidiphila]